MTALLFFLAFIGIHVVPLHVVDDRLSPVLHEVEFHAMAKCEIQKPYRFSAIIVSSALMPSESLGYCFKGPLTSTIVINEGHWNKLDAAGKFQVMAHEWAHCMIDKKHVNDYHNYMNSFYMEIAYLDTVEQLRYDVEEYCDRIAAKARAK